MYLVAIHLLCNGVEGGVSQKSLHDLTRGKVGLGEYELYSYVRFIGFSPIIFPYFSLN